MESNLSSVTGYAEHAAVDLTNALLANDNGVNERSYRELITLLGVILTNKQVDTLKKAVRATDGQFYLPEGVIFNPFEGA
jgi:hypothetical protein